MNDYSCSACNRKQRKIGAASGELITQKDIETLGWTKRGDKYLCPFCSGNEEKLNAVFGLAEEIEQPKEKP